MKLKDIKRAIKKAYKYYKSYWQDSQEIYFELRKVEYDYEMNESENEAPCVTVEFCWGNSSQNVHYTGRVSIYDWCDTPDKLAAYIMGIAQEKEMC